MLTPRSAYPSSNPQKTPNDVSTTRITKVASAARQAIVNVRLPEATFTAIVFRSSSVSCRGCRTWRRPRAGRMTAPRSRPDRLRHRSTQRGDRRHLGRTPRAAARQAGACCRASWAGRADAWGSFSHFIYPQNRRLRPGKPAPTACFFHVCRDFRSLRGRQILVRGQLLLHLAAFRRVEPPLYFFVWSGRCAHLVWSGRSTRASDQERQGGDQRVEERSPD